MGLGFAFLLLFGFAFFAPFLAGAENLIGLLIIGIGLYEAWKINKRVEPHTAGPFRIAAGDEGTQDTGIVI